MSVELPLYIFLIIYAVYLLIFLIFSLFNIYHITKHGFKSVSVYLILTFYIIVSVGMILVTWYYLQDINWQENISLLSQDNVQLKFQ